MRLLPLLWAVCFVEGMCKIQGTFECMSTIQLWITPQRDFTAFFPVLHIVILGCMQLSTIITTALVRGPVPDPARAPADLAEAPDPAAAAAEALAEDEAVSAEAADKNFSSMKRSLACILSPYLKKGGCFV